MAFSDCRKRVGVGAIDVRGAEIGKRAEFHVKYVADGAVCLDAGRNAGLSEGVKLTVKRLADAGGEGSRPQKAPAVVGQVRVVSVAQVSAVCEVVSQTGEFQRGDIAFLEAEDAEALTQQSVMSGVRKYPQVITFTEGDPLEEEARESVPRPPLPEINRARSHRL